jgi:hypothetical protein
MPVIRILVTIAGSPSHVPLSRHGHGTAFKQKLGGFGLVRIGAGTKLSPDAGEVFALRTFSTMALLSDPTLDPD